MIAKTARIACTAALAMTFYMVVRALTFDFDKDAGKDVVLDFKGGKAGKDLISFQGMDLHSFADVIEHAKDISRGVVISYDEGRATLG